MIFNKIIKKIGLKYLNLLEPGTERLHLHWIYFVSKQMNEMTLVSQTDHLPGQRGLPVHSSAPGSVSPVLLQRSP